jgi:hypothetical protein
MGIPAQCVLPTNVKGLMGCRAASARVLGPLWLPSPAQVVSSILRNLSWRADINSKKVLREVGSMTALMHCVLRASKVGTRQGWGSGGTTTANRYRPQAGSQ